MKVTRIYSGQDGQSHFEDLDVPLKTYKVGAMSAEIPLTVGMFRDTTEGPEVYDFHVAPRRQFVLHFTGRVQIECADGSSRQFGPGEILLADDTTGQGHVSREIEGPRSQMFIGIDPDLDFSAWRTVS